MNFILLNFITLAVLTPISVTVEDVKDSRICKQYGLDNCVRCSNVNPVYSDIILTLSIKPTCYECMEPYIWNGRSCEPLPINKGEISGWGRTCAECGAGNYWSVSKATCKPCTYEASGCSMIGACCDDVQDLGCRGSYSINSVTQKCYCSKGAHFNLYGKCYCVGQVNVYLDLDTNTNEAKCTACQNKCPVGCENFNCPIGTYLSGCECLPVHYSCLEAVNNKEENCISCRTPFEMVKVSDTKNLCLCPCGFKEQNNVCVRQFECTINSCATIDSASKILQENDFTTYFNPWINNQSNKYSLVYRATRDGFRSLDFHRLVNGISDTVTIIRDYKEFIFGGYTPLKWKSTETSSVNAYVADPSMKSFTYSMVNRIKYPLVDYKMAIYDCFNQGPTFGDGNDLALVNPFNTNYLSYRAPLSYDYSHGVEIYPHPVKTYFASQEVEIYRMLPYMSSTILGKSNFDTLSLWINGSPANFYLLYRLSRDGQYMVDYHRMCNGFANTITVIKDTNGNIFGAYTPLAFKSTTSYSLGSYITDDSMTSFTFSFTTMKKYPLKTARYAIYDTIDQGPTFGDGNDLVFGNDCAKACYRSPKDYDYSAGIDIPLYPTKTRFSAAEVEVFLVA